ncbi:MAG: DUF308 domain-containing protein [Proteobacteria bacterium]|nr:DUF308 domain-containing protein [Pseudomonadota bacterium]
MTELSSAVKKKSNAATIWGVLTIILGIFVMGAPMLSGVMVGITVSVLIAIAMIIAGVSQTLYAFQAGSIGRGILMLLFGGITIVAGIAIITKPGIALAMLTMFLTIYFIVDGIMTLIASTAVEQGKGLMIFNGIITLILGIMLWRGWPVAGIWAIGILLGIRLFFSGITMLALGSVGRGVADGLSEE